jgi:hypothetical protein
MTTEKHREIYPLPIEQISKQSSFPQIFGSTQSEYTEEERKLRWNKATSFKGGEAVKEYYEDIPECSDCIHNKNRWCAFASLPCGVNPLLTFGTGMVGIACQGIGKEKAGQKELFEETNGLGF